MLLRRSAHILFCSVFVLVLACPLRAVAELYSFTHIGVGVGPPSINDAGTVVFVDGEGIAIGNGGAITRLVTMPVFVNGEPLVGFSDPSISNSEFVSFWGALGSRGQGIFRASVDSFTTIYTAPIAESLNHESGVNNAGKVVFGPGFVGDGGPPVQIPIPPGTAGMAVSINDLGEVAFIGRKPDDTLGVYKAAGGSIITIVERTFPLFLFGDRTSINNRGQVSFKYFDFSSPSPPSPPGFLTGILVGDGTSLTILVDNTGAFRSVGNSSINDHGTVAFIADLRSGGTGIFTGPDPVRDKVIATGDLLFGSPVRTLVIGSEGLNNGGQITFFATTASGPVGVFRADPIAPASTVPVPSSVVLLSSGLFLVLVRHRLRRA